MEADTEFKIQARFEKHDEFVKLQTKILSLDTNPQASDEEVGRRINLVRKVTNIVCRTWSPIFLQTYSSCLVCRISRAVISAGPILRRIGDASSREVQTLCPRPYHWQLPFRRYRDIRSQARVDSTVDPCIISAVQLSQVQRL
jgi:hypothetical protein